MKTTTLAAEREAAISAAEQAAAALTEARRNGADEEVDRLRGVCPKHWPRWKPRPMADLSGLHPN